MLSNKRNRHLISTLLLMSFSLSALASDYEIRIPFDARLSASGTPEDLQPDAEAWENFADENNLTYTDWSTLDWQSKGLQSIPLTPYPLTSTAGMIRLHGNNISDISGFMLLTNVGANLTLSSNNISTLAPLLNIQNVEGNLNLQQNPLADLHGINNMKVGGVIRISTSYSGPKLPSNTIFCTENTPSQFPSGYARKHNICDE